MLAGQASEQPTNATGTHGTLRLTHNRPAPGVKVAIAPVRDRVPSGKISKGVPLFSKAEESPLWLPLWGAPAGRWGRH